MFVVYTKCACFTLDNSRLGESIFKWHEQVKRRETHLVRVTHPDDVTLPEHVTARSGYVGEMYQIHFPVINLMLTYEPTARPSIEEVEQLFLQLP